MIDIDFKLFGLLKSREVWYGKELPSVKGYHFIHCKNFFVDILFHHPFEKISQPTVLIDLTKDLDDLFGEIYKRRRQKIRRGFKEDIQIVHQPCSKRLLKESFSLFNKYRVPLNDPVSCSQLLHLANNITIFSGYHHGQLLVREIIIHDGLVAYRHMNIINGAIKNPATTYIGGVLIWELIVYFKKLGYHFLDLSAGLNPFKLSFGGEITLVHSYFADVSPLAKTLRQLRSIFNTISKKIRAHRSDYDPTDPSHHIHCSRYASARFDGWWNFYRHGNLVDSGSDGQEK